MIQLECEIRRWKRSNAKKELPVQHAEINIDSQIQPKRMTMGEGLGAQDVFCEGQIILSNHLGFRYRIRLIQARYRQGGVEVGHQTLNYKGETEKVDIKEEVKKDLQGEGVLSKCIVKLMDLEVQVEVAEIKGFFKILHLIHTIEEELGRQDKI